MGDRLGGPQRGSAVGSRLTVKWMNDKGEEVSKGWATYALVSEYDDDDNLLNEDFGAVGEQVDAQTQE